MSSGVTIHYKLVLNYFYFFKINTPIDPQYSSPLSVPFPVYRPHMDLPKFNVVPPVTPNSPHSFLLLITFNSIFKIYDSFTTAFITDGHSSTNRITKRGLRTTYKETVYLNTNILDQDFTLSFT